MSRVIVPGARITGVACAVPRNVMKNEDERVAKMVGVQERRHLQEGLSLLTLAGFAAGELLLNLGHPSIDAIVFVTQTAPRRMPSVSCELQESLGLPKTTLAFDLNMACSGYVYGLWVAASLRLPRVLLVVGDTISRFLDPKDASTYPIFGDAVSATVIEQVGENARIEFVGGTDGCGAESLCITDGAEWLQMDGPAVFQFALSTVPSLIEQTTMSGNIDWLLLHQANAMLLQHIVKKAKVDPAKVPSNIARYGNTSSASIPLLMCDSECTESLRTKTNALAMCGFGAGLSWGGILTETKPMPCSVVEV